MTSTKIIEGAKEALAIAKGEQPAAAIWHNGFKYVPSDEVEKLKGLIRRLTPSHRDPNGNCWCSYGRNPDYGHEIACLEARAAINGGEYD